MQAIAHENELQRISEIKIVQSIDLEETDGGIIKGLLWALAIMVPIYVGIYWTLTS
jgi:hypothetical protein